MIPASHAHKLISPLPLHFFLTSTFVPLHHCYIVAYNGSNGSHSWPDWWWAYISYSYQFIRNFFGEKETFDSCPCDPALSYVLYIETIITAKWLYNSLDIVVNNVLPVLLLDCWQFSPLSFQFLLPFPFLVLPCSALPVTVLPYRVETRQSHAIWFADSWVADGNSS